MLNLAKQFVQKDERGNVAIIFALALFPVMGLVGAAVDYSRLALRKTSLQSVADSAALAGAVAMMKNADQLASVQEAAATAAATGVADGRAPSAQETVTSSASQKSVVVQLTETENMIFGGFF